MSDTNEFEKKTNLYLAELRGLILKDETPPRIVLSLVLDAQHGMRMRILGDFQKMPTETLGALVRAQMVVHAQLFQNTPEGST